MMPLFMSIQLYTWIQVLNTATYDASIGTNSKSCALHTFLFGKRLLVDSLRPQLGTHGNRAKVVQFC